MPIETPNESDRKHSLQNTVAFTPKGGCPLKRNASEYLPRPLPCSIHPQGWVSIETRSVPLSGATVVTRSIHPQGWVPTETGAYAPSSHTCVRYVAFTPKGGCRLKPGRERVVFERVFRKSSIHPQGWVPIETRWSVTLTNDHSVRSIHPQGWVLVRETVVGAHGCAPLHGWV